MDNLVENSFSQKICGVCGDKALGYNFNALTCESCKAFFRRNALRNKRFICISGTKCNLNPKTRKYCRKCRLDRCFEIGMKKEWILTEEEKFLKRRKHRCIETKDADSSTMIVEENSQCEELKNSKQNEKQADQANESIDSVLGRNNVIVLPIFSSTNQTLEEFRKSLNRETLIALINKNLRESKSLKSFSNGINSSTVENEQISNDINSTSSLVSSSKELPQLLTCSNEQSKRTDQIKHNDRICDSFSLNRVESCDNLEKRGEIEISKNVYDNMMRLEYLTENLRANSSKDLNPIEQERLNELDRIFEPLNTIDDHDLPRKIIETVAEGFECLESSIKQLIIVIKNARAFKNLCAEDQMTLMKMSVSKIKSLINIRCYDPTCESWILPYFKKIDRIFVLDEKALRHSYGDSLYDRCKRFALSFREDWKKDNLIMSLLIMIMLFFPNRPAIRHREYITLEYLSYCHLLFRYLNLKYKSPFEAKSVYLNLLARLEQLDYFTEECIETIIMKFDSKCIGPLTSEVYDVKRKLKHS
ncbi:hypothetical protein NH340_JMT04579 [Sarcoptes scabiei]|nr:hypothetical protein NH340_JMT04579 [Sarcoptes scabiei]